MTEKCQLFELLLKTNIMILTFQYITQKIVDVFLN